MGVTSSGVPLRNRLRTSRRMGSCSRLMLLNDNASNSGDTRTSDFPKANMLRMLQLTLRNVSVQMSTQWCGLL
eukprot:m.57358 g.57358  ORF g.57358 m.57358 type:complete len:73 (+) comp11102_c0_seq1:2147-2365(+)